MDNMSIRQQIIDELEFEPSVDAARIAVAVTDGIATLAGSVGSYAEKVAAEQAALRVKGVRGVAQEIKVVFPDARKTGDEEIARRAIDIIDWDASLPSDKVKVKVQAGWLTLTGDVEWQYQKTGAENAVRKLTGITGISNQITVRPAISAGDIRARIEDALKRNASIEAGAIRVAVAGNAVTLEGRVHAWSERSAAEQAAWSAPGVMSVSDHLVVA